MQKESMIIDDGRKRNGEDGRSKEFVLEGEDDVNYKVLELDGMVFPMSLFDCEEAVKKRLSIVENIKYEPGDVMICSFPKTGLHWTTNIVHFLLQDGPLEKLVSHSNWFIDYVDFRDVNKRENERIITTHHTMKRLPKDHFANGGKTILLFRNPKDSAVSMYHMMRKQNSMGDFRIPWERFLAYWLEGKIIFGSYFEYYRKWQEDLMRNPNLNVLIVQYEELKSNTLHEVRRIQNYFDLNHSDERLEAVIERCSLKNLKDDIDSGIIGDWKNHFTVAQNEHFEAIANEKMKDSIFNYKAWD